MSDRAIDKLAQPKHVSVLIEGAGAHSVDTCARYEGAEFARMRTELNALKSQFDKFNNSGDAVAALWRQYQNIVDIYKDLRFRIAAKFNAQATTNAWMKFYELVVQYKLIPSTSAPFKIFFNAEFPGGFAAACNHYVKTIRPDLSVEWRASSLAEGLATGNDVALGDTYGLFKMNPANWMMNSTNNGDATNTANIRDWGARLGPGSEFGGVDLYSHDAGMDVSDDYNNQETTNAKLHLGCACAGFITMKKGASFVAKQYTIFETFSWNLIIIYAGLFEQFYLCKPYTSRPYNSEIYLVGKGFKGISDELLESLLARLDNFSMEPLAADMESPARASIARFCRIMFGQQEDFLRENLDLMARFGQSRASLDKLANGIKQLKFKCQNAWLAQYPIVPLPYEKWLPAVNAKRGAAMAPLCED